uniref:Malic enzyme 3, NADP(+)-dependent, mitochondrial n=1 Tax=Cyclopterus lumpus TaxID=8103 RepID=A0A8C2WJ11_CYCLU
MAFTLEERLQLGIHGLLPPCFLSQDVQVLRVMKSYETRSNPLDKYILLMTLQDRNEKLFYRVLTSDIEEFMPIVYTPTVGLACQQYGHAFRRPRGLFITIHDKGHIATMLNSWPEEDIKVHTHTHTHTAQCLPVLLDVGTDNQELLDDPLYIGLKHKRIRGKEYDDLVDEFMQAVTDKYGMSCLIQFEDFANRNAFRILNKYRSRFCTFNDDIQVAVAGILAALKITRNTLLDHTVVFQGAGEVRRNDTQVEGVSREEAAKRIWDWWTQKMSTVCNLNHEKLEFAHDTPHIQTLEEVVHTVKPTATSEWPHIAGAFTENIIKDMAAFNERPIIFALSNPPARRSAPRSSCKTNPPSVRPRDPGRWTHLLPRPGNNAYVFPGVALGVIACGVRHISDDIFLTTAEVLSSHFWEHLAEGRLYPPLNTIREPKDKEAFVLSHIYSPDYDSFALDTYSWPQDAMNVQDV